jgi:hypothetical protein
MFVFNPPTGDFYIPCGGIFTLPCGGKSCRAFTKSNALAKEVFLTPYSPPQEAGKEVFRV